MKRIKKGDTVKILAGKDKGQTGKILRVIGEKVLVDGMNLVKKHVKPNPQIQEQGGIKTKEAPLHVSNVALLNPQTNEAGKVGFKFIEAADGSKRKVRYFKSNDELVDIV